MKSLNLLVSSKASVIIDGQFGSTGKGLIAAYVGLTEKVDVAITNAAPNAGHTAIIPLEIDVRHDLGGEVWTESDGWGRKIMKGTKLVTYHLPMTGVLQPDALIYLNAGSIIDVPKLIEEMKVCNVSKNRVLIHPRAAILEPQDAVYEMYGDSAATRLGSTRKGVGRALARKVMREGRVALDAAHDELKDFRIGRIEGVLGPDWMRNKSTLIEMPQGFDLSINHGLSYPHCTSRDITVASALADCGMHPRDLGKTLMTLRTYPIRVGHIHRDNGEQIGNSGPCWADQEELKWSDIGVEPELTTVTKRPRRIFSFSRAQFERACQINRPDILFLNFFQYMKSHDEWMALVRDLFNNSAGTVSTCFGTGPKVTDIHTDSLAAEWASGWPVSATVGVEK